MDFTEATALGSQLRSLDWVCESLKSFFEGFADGAGKWGRLWGCAGIYIKTERAVVPQAPGV